MNKLSQTTTKLFTIGGGRATETPSWAQVPPAAWASAPPVSSAPYEVEIGPGAKVFAFDYADGKSKQGVVVAKSQSECFLVSFFDKRAAQHTRRKDITGVKKAGGVAVRAPVLAEPSATLYKAGDKVWAFETGKGVMPGRVIEVFGGHQSALVKFFHETGHPSQNTFFTEISKEKPK
jgi:hypothetical protein